MSSKILKLSFPKEDYDIYLLLKSKVRPSKYVVEAVRFYNLYKNKKKRLTDDEMEALLEEKLNKRLEEELGKLNIEQLINSRVSEILKTASVNLSNSVDISMSSNHPCISSTEDSSDIDFSESIGMFDDDD